MPGRSLQRVMIAGGGTGGHVIPGLAIGRALREEYGADVRFIGTARGLETKLVPDAGFALELVRSGQLKNVSLATRLRTLLDVPMGVERCLELMRAFRPQVVVGVGGYASGPAMVAALLLRVPTLVFEPNAMPGLTNRLVGKRVSAAAVNFRETMRYFRKAQVTGIPVRAEFFALPPKRGGARRLLVFGGSQGARILNAVMPAVVQELLVEFADLEIVHQTGARHLESTLALYARAGVPRERVRVQAYIEDMVAEFAAADVVMCRSGASTVAELAAAGKASVLVPFAAAADDHQRKNADAFVEVGAAVLIVESELTPQIVAETVGGMLREPERLWGMGETARRLAHRDAVERILAMIVSLA